VRLLSVEVGRDLSNPVIVENKPGAGTVIGVDAVAKATDQHTFGGVANSFTVNQTLVKSLPYKTLDDLAPVILLAKTANVLAIKPSLGIKNLQELIAYAKKNPGKLSYGSFGNGTTPHFGNIDLMFGNLPDFISHIRSGKLVALGTTYLTRAPLAPEIPTIAEQGLPKFETDSWYGIIAPVATSPLAISTMNAALNKALQNPAVKKNLAERGIEVIGGTPAAFGDHLRAEVAKYAQIVKSSNMKID
jgi:tripartite-type tricarboxylate transporter receptor subunit TctC